MSATIFTKMNGSNILILITRVSYLGFCIHAIKAARGEFMKQKSQTPIIVFSLLKILVLIVSLCIGDSVEWLYGLGIGVIPYLFARSYAVELTKNMAILFLVSLLTIFCLWILSVGVLVFRAYLSSNRIIKIAMLILIALNILDVVVFILSIIWGSFALTKLLGILFSAFIVLLILKNRPF